MWSCDRGQLRSSIVDVLNGDYPAADVRRMSVPGLERLVARLVQCTAEAGAEPRWWPRGVAFGPLDLGPGQEGEAKLALKRLVVDCSQFFRERTRWEWNDENRPRKRFRPLTVGKAEALRRDGPSKHQFLRYFRLDSKRCKGARAAEAPVHLAAAKLTNCVHIPFSSDVGRIMAAREHHCVPDDIKLKRLERSEWYINKRTPRAGEVEFEHSGTHKEPHHVHRYKIPKRQQHHKRRSLHSAEFLARFCTPLVVNVDRLDLAKVKRDRDKTRRELVVVIDKTEKTCCDVKSNQSVRTSPRLKSV